MVTEKTITAASKKRSLSPGTKRAVTTPAKTKAKPGRPKKSGPVPSGHILVSKKVLKQLQKGIANLKAGSASLKKTWVIAEIEARKIFLDPTEIILRAIQPALWLHYFGQVSAKMRAAQGQTDYLDFMTQAY